MCQCLRISRILYFHGLKNSSQLYIISWLVQYSIIGNTAGDQIRRTEKWMIQDYYAVSRHVIGTWLLVRPRGTSCEFVSPVHLLALFHWLLLSTKCGYSGLNEISIEIYQSYITLLLSLTLIFCNSLDILLLESPILHQYRVFSCWKVSVELHVI